MTKDEKYLSEVQARCEAATAGKWEAVQLTDVDGKDGESAEQIAEYVLKFIKSNASLKFLAVLCDSQLDVCHVGNGPNGRPANANFIEYARTDVPRLLQMVREREEKLKAAEAECERLRATQKRLLKVWMLGIEMKSDTPQITTNFDKPTLEWCKGICRAYEAHDRAENAIEDEINFQLARLDTVATPEPAHKRNNHSALDELATPILNEREPAQPSTVQPWMEAESLAQLFHETYERLAPNFGYETRKASAKPWSEVPDQNKALMVAVCAEIIASHAPSLEREAQLVKAATHVNFNPYSSQYQAELRSALSAYKEVESD